MKFALGTFRVYLLGREFIIQTDHAALAFLNRMHNDNRRLVRWYLSMQP